MTSQCFDKAKALIDAANSEDPNQENTEGKSWPKELLYSRRMSDMLERYVPDADNAMKLAASAQHIQRWKSPRSDYPMDRKGYHQWRAGLCKFHSDTVADLLAKAGYENTFIARVAQAVGKKSLKTNPDTQLLEDVAGLVFLEHYLLDFASKHPEYDEQKWIDIIDKVWKKMSVQAHHFVLDQRIKLPDALAALIRKAASE
ncbi:DUF4202 domain-containing protein [Nitrosomonas supralitoralis]|uniref:DUF4202 domain-containing protein n=1 Tax=Nitrosomonas supralitoralis TaxID=2116706 RepID=A0A2P7NSG9_9PROT|nr:DUF4202 domain-containing protein [Nitrosomonas supralitoralis]PSJ16421.1 DUF4202 domain-containing protein [Nitrosomonas supralitoralis]